MNNTTQAQETRGKLFFPKQRVNAFAGDAAYQRADKLAEAITGVVTFDEKATLSGIRGVYTVLRDYADVLGDDRVVVDYTPDVPLADFGFIEIDLPKLGKVYARAIGADKFWRENLCDAPFRLDIRRAELSADLWITGNTCYVFHYEGNWWNVPASVREQLIKATNGIKDEYFSKSGLKRVEAERSAA